ncbi:MAG: hypothetical protein AAFZ63_26800 [Bacteroidota bacterium]
MKELQELINIVSIDKLNGAAVLGQSGEEQLEAFYNLLVDDTSIVSDAQASRLLLGKPVHHPRYLDLKERLEKRMVDMLFLIDVNQAINNNSSLAYEEALRLWSAANLMILHNALRMGLEYAEKSLRLAIRYEHSELVVPIAKLLRKIYATYLGNEQQFEYYDELYERYQKISAAEAQAELAYQQVLMATASGNKEAAIAKIAKDCLGGITPLLAQYSTCAIHRHVRYVEAIYLLNAGHYQDLIRQVDTAVAFFQQKDIDLRDTILGMRYFQLIASIMLQDGEKGLAIWQQCQSLLGQEINATYFKMHELGLLLLFYTNQYQEAYTLGKTVLNLKQLSQQSCAVQQSWITYGAYLQYLSVLGEVGFEANDSWAQEFRWRKILKAVPTFNKAYRNTHVPLLIIHILYALHQQNYDLAAERIHTIGRYGSKYLRNDAALRTNCFLHMLQQLIPAGFHRRATERYVQKFKKRLQQAPLSMASQPYEIEILPYELLWDLLMKSLPQKRVSVRLTGRPARSG